MIVDQCAREPGSVARAICPGHSGTTGAAQSCLGWTAPDPFPSPLWAVNFGPVPRCGAFLFGRGETGAPKGGVCRLGLCGPERQSG